MLKTTIIFIAGITLVSAACAQAPSAMSSHAAYGDMAGMQIMNSSNASKKPFDLQFLDTMTVHHQGAVAMAKLVDSHAAHDELKIMAKKMIDDQEAEIRQLTDWKKQWYASAGDAINMDMPGMRESMKGMSMDKLDATTGNEFDLMFIDMMIKHHMGAVGMARQALQKAKHIEIKSFSKNVIRAQTEEINRMKRWKKEWAIKK